MKYVSQQLLGQTPQVVWEGFAIPTQSSYGADKLAEELNRLDHLATQRDQELVVQIEAKNNALRKVSDLEKQLMGTPTNRELKQRLGVRTGQVHELLDVLERCQSILAQYITPLSGIRPKVALTSLLDILDGGDLIDMMRNLRELISVKNNGSVELTRLQKAHVLQALDETAQLLRNYTSEQPASYAEACRILGASEDGDVSSPEKLMAGGAPWWATHFFQDGATNDWFYGRVINEKCPRYWIDSDTQSTSTRMWTENNIVAGTLQEVSANGSQKKFPEVGAEMLVTLKRGPDGKQYLSGFGLGIEQPFIVQADQVFINGACIESTVSAMELGTAIHEGLERVVNNTTNHFAAEPKASKKELEQLRKATEYFEQYADAHPNPLPENTCAAKHLRKLLKKLS